MCKGVIFDFNRTIFNPNQDGLMEGATDLLNYLKEKNYRLSLLSKTNYPGREEQINALGIEKYFDDIIVTYGNKQESHFKRLIGAMKIESFETIVIGDRVKSEILIGNQMGMRTIWLRKGKFKDEWPAGKNEKPDFIIYNLEQILNDPEKYLNC